MQLTMVVKKILVSHRQQSGLIGMRRSLRFVTPPTCFIHSRRTNYLSLSPSMPPRQLVSAQRGCNQFILIISLQPAVPPPARKPGRPKKRKYTRPPSPSPPPPATPEPATPTKSIAPSSDASGESADSPMARLLGLKAQVAFRHGPASPRAKRPTDTRLTALKALHRDTENGWVLLEQGIHGYDLPEWFEEQVRISFVPAFQTAELIICGHSEMISMSKNITKQVRFARFGWIARATGPKTSVLAVSVGKLIHSAIHKFAVTWSPYVYPYIGPHSLVLKLAVGTCNWSSRTKKWSDNGTVQAQLEVRSRTRMGSQRHRNLAGSELQTRLEPAR
jgi:hypothetical protein